MKKLLIATIGMFFVLSNQSFSQVSTGTLKIFSEIEGVVVFVDEVQQSNYQNIENLPTGTHYVRVMNGDQKIYSQVVTINKDQVSTILIEQSEKSKTIQSEKPAEVIRTQQGGQTGTLNIFSEISGISVYLNDQKQGDDIKTINSVPAGDHYLKVLKDGVNLYGELVKVTAGQTTTVLIRNDGQVAEKVMEGKVKEREEYNSSKVDVLFASKSLTTTQGASTIFPGYYGYWGYSNSISSTTEIPDFKIVKGGVEEISDISLATLAGNKAILDEHAKNNLKIQRRVSVGAPMLLVGIIATIVYIADFTVDKPFLHKENPEHPDYETYVATGGILATLIGYGIVSSSDKVHPAHYYRVQDAARDAQVYNSKLKEKLGLPAGYDVK